MKKLIVEVDEDYLNELYEAFKKKPMGGIPTHRAWALLEGLKNGTPLDGLANGELITRIINPDSEDCVGIECKDGIVTFQVTQDAWDRKWGE